MRKLKLEIREEKTINDGFDEFIDRCNAKNLRPATLKHYKESWNQIRKYLDTDQEVKTVDKKTVNQVIIKMKETGIKNQTLYTYARDLKTIAYFFMEQGYIARYKIELPKVDSNPIEPYTEEEIEKLIRKPSKKCSFTQYRNWCITCFILSTGLRLSSLINIKIKDIDLQQSIVYVHHTKNRKPLIMPLNQQINKILKEWLKVRQYESSEEYLFCNVFGKQLTKNTITQALMTYNKEKNVNITGIHRLRHTFAKQWIMSGNSVVTLQKILGHSSLAITQHYVNIMITDLEEDVNNNNILMKFSKKYYKTTI